jgi:prepilin-type N-terminal cleavage/methylation domain-containing protein
MTGSSFASAQRRPSCGARAPRGFTIVELLVVVSIMASLFGLIVVGMRPSVGGELRRAAQQFASVLLAAQSRGLGDPKGAAVVLELDTRSVAAGGPKVAGTQCISIFTGDKPPFAVGTATGMPPVNAGATSATVVITVTNGGDLQQGYRVQFFGSDPDSVLPASAWFGFQPPGTVSLRAGDGQSLANTAWPTPVGGQLKARVACYPAKGPLAVAFPKTVGIDLRYSGTGDDPATAWGGLASKGDLAVSFDSVGTLDALMRGVGGSTAASRQPVEPVYFLVAARADLDEDTALASDRSLWVAIQPQTGRVTTSANVPQSGKDRVAVRAARANARAALATGK